MSSPHYLTTGEGADALGVQTWRVARLFQLKIVKEPPRIGGRRLIPKTIVPDIVDGLRERGWLEEPDRAEVSAK